MESIRRDPRFMALAKRLGLVDYWQKSGAMAGLLRRRVAQL
jgi:hypothetical protein